MSSSTNLLIMVNNATLTVVDCCAPSSARLAAYCLTAGAAVISLAVAPKFFQCRVCYTFHSGSLRKLLNLLILK